MVDSLAEPDTTWELRYLLVLTDSSYFDLLIEECVHLNPRVLFNQPETVSVIEIRSPRSYSNIKPSPHSLIEADLAEMRSSVDFLSKSFLEIDSQIVGQRWPVLVEVGPEVRSGPQFADFTCSWDHLILRNTDPELADQMLAVAGKCLALYYILRSLVMLTSEVAHQLLVKDEHGDGDPGLSVKLTEMSLRRDLIRATEILADARPTLYWGCEHRLYSAIRESWGIDSLSASAHESAEVITQILSDRRARENAQRAEQSAAASRRSSIALLLLTLIAGVSALADLIDFGLSSGDPTFLRWRLGISGSLLFLVLLLVFFNRAVLTKPHNTMDGGGI